MLKKCISFVFSILMFALVNLTHNVFAQTVKADYRFGNSRSSTVAGAPDLTDIGIGTNTFVTATVDGMSRAVLEFPQGNGLRLAPTTAIVPNDVYTIVVLFEFDTTGAGSGYRRVLDFKNGTSDGGLYVLSGNLTVFPTGIAGSTTLAPNTYYQVVLTRDAAGTVVGYVDGVQQFTFGDTSQIAAIDSNNALRFFRDNESGGGGGEQSGGSVARIRLFDGALTAAQVAALDRIAAPTAASVSIAGRVTTPQDLGLTNALVTLTDSKGGSRTALTRKDGNFQFTEVAAGETYILSVRSKRYSFTPQIVTANEDLVGLSFAPR